MQEWPRLGGWAPGRPDAKHRGCPSRQHDGRQVEPGRQAQAVHCYSARHPCSRADTHSLTGAGGPSKLGTPGGLCSPGAMGGRRAPGGCVLGTTPPGGDGLGGRLLGPPLSSGGGGLAAPPGPGPGPLPFGGGGRLLPPAPPPAGGGGFPAPDGPPPPPGGGGGDALTPAPAGGGILSRFDIGGRGTRLAGGGGGGEAWTPPPAGGGILSRLESGGRGRGCGGAGGGGGLKHSVCSSALTVESSSRPNAD